MEFSEFGKHCEKGRRALLAYAYTCCGDLHLAEDVVQETMLIAYRKREQYFPEADFQAWLISIARHVWFRERERRGIAARAKQYMHDIAPLLFDPEDYSEEKWPEERRALVKCLEKLDEVTRALIQGHFAKGLKYREIAKAMKRTLTWVKVRMHRARTVLRECVQLTLAGSGENQ